MSSIIFRLETPRLFLELPSEEDPRASSTSCLSPPEKRALWRQAGKLPFVCTVQSLLFYTSPHPPPNYRIILKESNNKIGIIGFFKWDPNGKRGTIGFSLDKQYRNQGLMTEATRTFLDAWFGEGKISWIEGRCQPDNRASERVLVKSGMTLRNTVEEPLFKGSRLYRLHVYGISKTEWLARKHP